MVVEVERATKQLAVFENFRRTRVTLGGHVAGLFKKGKVGVGLNIAHATGVAVPVPGAAEVAALFHDAEIGDSLVLQVDAREHAGKPATNNDNFSFFNDRITGEVGIGVGILVEFFELFLQTGKLLQTIGAQTLELFLRVLGAKFLNRNLDAFVLLCHYLFPLEN